MKIISKIKSIYKQVYKIFIFFVIFELFFFSCLRHSAAKLSNDILQGNLVDLWENFRDTILNNLLKRTIVFSNRSDRRTNILIST